MEILENLLSTLKVTKNKDKQQKNKRKQIL